MEQLEKDQEPGKGQVSDYHSQRVSGPEPGLRELLRKCGCLQWTAILLVLFAIGVKENSFFSEFINIVQEGENFSFMLKHFNADLSPWEKKEEWTTPRLIKVAENTVYFHGLTMKREADKLKLQLALNEDGVKTIEELSYVKKKFQQHADN